jgi:hypothetical protein
MEANEGFTETQETRGRGMSDRTGDEMVRIIANAKIAVFLGEMSIEQGDWVETFFTLPPSAESLRKAAA